MQIFRHKARFEDLLYPRAYFAMVLIAGVLLAAVFGPVFFPSEPAVDSTAVHDAEALPDIFPASDPVDIPSYLDEKIGGFDDEAPSFFADEVFEGQNGRYSADGDGAIAGFLFSCNVDASMEMILECMTEKGWHVVSSGHGAIATLVKDCGEYRWAMLSCEAVGQDTSAVLNVRKRYERSQ